MLRALCTWDAQRCDIFLGNRHIGEKLEQQLPTPSLLSSDPSIEAGWLVGLIPDTGWVLLILLPPFYPFIRSIH
jgi:hypothetical protein